MDKRGILGGMMVTFIATIVIIIILLVFSFGAVLVKTFDDVAEGLVVRGGKAVGLKDVWDYMSDYLKLVEVRVLVRKGSVRDALLGVGYDK